MNRLLKFTKWMIVLLAVSLVGCGSGLELIPGEIVFMLIVLVLVLISGPLFIWHEHASARVVQEERDQQEEQLRGEENARLDRIRSLFEAKSFDILSSELVELANRLRQVTYAGERREVAEEIYRLILGALKANPGFAVITLDFGRLYYGIGRAEDNPSVYDESAIMNDIAVHR